LELEGESPADVESLKKELLEEQIRSKELLNRLKYAQADLENYRKRAEKEMAEAGETSLMGLVGRLLVVLDELSLAVKHAEAGGNGDALGEGFRMIQRNLEAALESVGVERIEALGRHFDPSLYEAAEKVEGAAEGDEVVVIVELRAGYTIRGKVLRPSLVKVGPAPREEEKDE